MRKYVTIFLSLLIALPMFAAGAKKGKKKPLSKTTKLPRISEPIYNNNILGPNHRFGPKVNYSNRDSDWSSSLIDSSLNGYGPGVSGECRLFQVGTRSFCRRSGNEDGNGSCHRRGITLQMG